MVGLMRLTNGFVQTNMNQPNFDQIAPNSFWQELWTIHLIVSNYFAQIGIDMVDKLEKVLADPEAWRQKITLVLKMVIRYISMFFYFLLSRSNTVKQPFSKEIYWDHAFFETYSHDDKYESYLHEVTDVLPVGQNLAQVLCSQHVSEGGGSEQTGGPGRILHVGDGYRGVRHPVVDHSIHGYRHWIFG